jgi:hypothetical protein
MIGYEFKVQMTLVVIVDSPSPGILDSMLGGDDVSSVNLSNICVKTLSVNEWRRVEMLHEPG